MYALQVDISSGEIKMAWDETYTAGSSAKPGKFSRGSGYTAALVGTKFVVMTDNAGIQVNLVVYRQVQNEPARLVALANVCLANVPVVVLPAVNGVAEGLELVHVPSSPKGLHVLIVAEGLEHLLGIPGEDVKTAALVCVPSVVGIGTFVDGQVVSDDHVSSP